MQWSDDPIMVEEVSRRLLMPWVKDRLGFAFNDPKRFSDTPVNPVVFGAVLRHLRDPNSGLSDANVITLVEHFCSSCQEKEWREFYQPVLKRTYPIPGATIGRFNLVAPGERLFPFHPQGFTKNPVEGEGFFYPLEGTGERLFVLIQKDSVEIVDEQFGAIPNDQQKWLLGEVQPPEGLDEMLVFEGYTGSETRDDMILTDFFPLSLSRSVLGDKRREGLELMYDRIFSKSWKIYLGDGFRGHPVDTDAMKETFSEMGYTGDLLFKPARGTYAQPAVKISPKT